MKITKSELREIIREELLNEKLKLNEAVGINTVGDLIKQLKKYPTS